jgi:hypothetical protein
MRVWDVAPGYLNRQSLLGEHREMHGLHNILVLGKQGYSRHPETVRWQGCVSGLAVRHAQIAAEMRLRGYVDRTPLDCEPDPVWPQSFVTPVADQIALLKSKYRGKERGRIRLPVNAQDLWAHHKYSVLARDPAEYRRIGRRVAALPGRDGLLALAEQLAVALRARPSAPRLANALEHMWGHVSDDATPDEHAASKRSAAGMLAAIQTAAVRVREPYLMSSTALSELAVFVSPA